MKTKEDAKVKINLKLPFRNSFHLLMPNMDGNLEMNRNFIQ